MPQELDPQDWPSIRFEGHVMPQSLKAISILVSAEGLSERAGDWIWRLCHCVGVVKRGDAERVANSASEIIDYMIERRIWVLGEMRARLGPHEFDSEATFSEWIEALTRIKELARLKSGECRWTAGTEMDTMTEAERMRLAQDLLDQLGED